MRVFLFFISLLLASTASAGPRRIVSLVPSTTEILYAVGAGKDLVAADNFSTYPVTANTLPKVGDYRGFSLEVVASMRPTHIVLVENYLSAADVEPLAKLGAKTVTCRNGAFEGGVDATIECIRKFANMFGDAAKGERIVDDIQEARQAVAAGSNEPSNVMIVLDTSPLYAVGPKNFIHEVFHAAGFRNVMADAPLTYPRISTETLLATKPDLVVTFRESFAEALRKLYSNVPPAKRPPIHVLDEDIFSRPGPRLAEAFRSLQKIRKASSGKQD